MTHICMWRRRFSRPENHNKELWRQNISWATQPMTVIWTSWISKFLGYRNQDSPIVIFVKKLCQSWGLEATENSIVVAKKKSHWFVQFVVKVFKVRKTWNFIPKFTFPSDVNFVANVLKKRKMWFVIRQICICRICPKTGIQVKALK